MDRRDRKPYVESVVAQAMKVAAVMLPLLLVLSAGCQEGNDEVHDDDTPTSTFILASSSFKPGTAIPTRHSCEGEGDSPPLTITGAPEGTQSIALTMKDPDVPTPEAPTRTIDHWVVWNVTVGTAVFPEGGVPTGASEGANDFGRGYLGPCPPPGSPPHRYNLTAYALDARPAVPENATAEQLEAAMAGHVLARTTLIGTYARQIAPTTTPSAPR